MTPVQQLAVAVVRVTEGAKTAMAPYFGAVLRGLIRRQMPVEMEAALGKNATLAVSSDGILWWSPSYVAKKAPDELAWDLIHESMHVCMKHFERADAIGVLPENRPLANLAQDASSNEVLRKSWPELGMDAVYPETLGQPEGLIWEARYRLLLQNKPPQQAGGVGRGTCGSCATGGDKKMPGAPSGEKGLTEAQLDRMRKQVAHDVKAHQQAKGIGSVPSELGVWADQQLAPPKVDWRQAVAKHIRAAIAYRAGCVDMTWKRPSRRQAGVGYGPGRAIMPAMHAPVPKVAVVFDVSGSMNQKRLVAAASELSGILAAAGSPVTVCVVDAVVHGVREVKTIDEALAMLVGGGGTDMGPGLRALAEQSNRPDVVVVLTDGEIPHPGDEPPFSVVWCVVAESETFVAPFGEAVFVDSEEQA